jgi:hypothetical protein
LTRLPTIAPLWYQLPSWRAVDRGKRFKISSYPRRHGKDVEDICIACKEAVERKGSYYYVFPTRQWAKRAIWDTVAEIGGVSQPIIDHAFPSWMVKRKNESDLFLELINGSMFFMGGTDNLDFVGQGGQGYTMSEFSLHKEQVTGLLAPIIRQSQAYLHLNGTMRGMDNPLYRIMQNTLNDDAWYSTWLTPETTRLYCWVGGEMNINPDILPYIGKTNPTTGKIYSNCQGVPYYNIQDDVDSGLISLTLARQEFLNRAEDIVTGSYFEDEMAVAKNEGRLVADRTLYDPTKEVYTFWDLGGQSGDNDKTCVAFAQMDNNESKAVLVDYYENTGKLRGHYLDILNSRGYTYGGHYVPHDAKRTSAWTGESMVDTARAQFGIDMRVVPKTNNTLSDIEIGRRDFKNFEFDMHRCERLVKHTGNYHESETTGKPCHKNNCSVCKGASHGADALRTMYMARSLGLVSSYINQRTRLKQPEVWDSDYIIV